MDEDSDNEFVADDDELLLVEYDCLPLQNTRNNRKLFIIHRLEREWILYLPKWE